ncbi:TlpA family protein disulfide reductase [Sunxiuqinia elliptica]|uniref:Peroxiredoxin n=1 Tax=Sunxiuqinia elliptica TaxID=655355 RepID=A0A4V3BZ47_9BACT|nr:TlpA disulfide reductase family protein [Sunxiuqinia elliptica]TDO05169.1 peroxiredoxin [Sunxiuqinia elliptica]TDO64718.1 peroxiredoxin [Sunxiuqinia elliptica]
MKFLTFIFIFAFTFANAQTTNQQVPDDYGYLVKVGQQAPDFTTETTDGKTVKLSDYKGKVVMLQFTASWCGVCRKEMPHIEKDIWQKHKDNSDFALFGIDLDEPREKVEKFGKQIPVTYPLLLDPKGGIFYSYAQKGAGVTRNVIIDKTGKMVYMTRLFKQEEFDEMKSVIEKLLK